MNKIEFSSSELWPVLNILNEICYGIKVKDFEKTIGVKKQVVIDFMDIISRHDDDKNVVLTFNDVELNFLIKSFEEVFRQIEEWEFQTRIGISIQDADKIKDKFKLN